MTALPRLPLRSDAEFRAECARLFERWRAETIDLTVEVALAAPSGSEPPGEGCSAMAGGAASGASAPVEQRAGVQPPAGPSTSAVRVASAAGLLDLRDTSRGIARPGSVITA